MYRIIQTYHTLSTLLYLSMASLIFLAGCASEPNLSKQTKMQADKGLQTERSFQCVSGLGNCFAVRLGDQDVSLLTEKNTQKIITKSKQMGVAIPISRWQLPKVISPLQVFDISVAVTQSGQLVLGKMASVTVVVYPLQLFDERLLAPGRMMAQSGSIRLQDLKERQLPIGDYVLTIQYNGIKSWDQKSVYIEVR